MRDEGGSGIPEKNEVCVVRGLSIEGVNGTYVVAKVFGFRIRFWI